MGLCRTSVEISSKTDRWQALWEWKVGWGNRLESDTKIGVQKEYEPKACRCGVGWAQEPGGAGVTDLPIIDITWKADGRYEPNEPGPNMY